MKFINGKLFATLCVSFLAAAASAADTDAIALIPLPQKTQRLDGVFHLTAQTRIYADGASRETAQFLARELRQSTGYPLTVHLKQSSDASENNGIFLTTQSADTNAGAEGYILAVATNSVVIRAPAQAGVFYGTRTLLQLLPPKILSTNVVAGTDWQMPCVQIEDWPRFKWRGLMLDVSRHFYSKVEIEKILDAMALYKLNTFHWHLTDDQGWRIEIKKYPKLTQIGAWRKQSNLASGEDVRGRTNARPAWVGAPASSYGPDDRYGGFYTRADIRDVVAWAAARRITIVPEIEMPGHSVAALAAYPQFSCFNGPYSTDVGAGIQQGIYNPANEQTFQFLENVLAEVFQLFPGRYIHIGGDEVQTNYWHNSPECQALMKREGLRNEYELQSWFVHRIEKFINANHKTLVGWSEIAQGGLATNAMVMDWIGGGTQAAEAGHDVVMTPTAYCYFDFYQDGNHAAEPKAAFWGGPLPLKKVYAFEPIPATLPPQFHSHILGAQGNLWTEFIASLPHAEYMVFPRLCALAEVVWSPKDSHDWDDFQKRLEIDEQRLNELGVNYRQNNSTDSNQNN